MRKRVWVGTISTGVLLLTICFVVVSRHVRFTLGPVPYYLRGGEVLFWEHRRGAGNYPPRTLFVLRLYGNNCMYLAWDTHAADSSSGNATRSQQSSQIPQPATDENEVTANESLTADREGGS
jgi:hypothetical protein